jgi:hypothetical protein
MAARSAIGSLALGAVLAVLTGCSGPRLRIYDALILSFDRSARTVGWRAKVENERGGTGWFCSRQPAQGWITMNAWLTKSTDLNQFPRIPAGGTRILDEGQELPVGASLTGGLGSATVQQQNLAGFTHLIIETYTKAADRGFPYPGDPGVNNSCCRYYTSVALPLP